MTIFRPAHWVLVMFMTIIAWDVQAGEKLSLRLGGYSKWWVVGAWKTQGDAHLESFPDVKGDNEIHFLAQSLLANGLTVGIKTELEAGGHTDQRTDPIDKAFVWISGAFGKLELGTDYAASGLLHVAAPEAAGLWNGPSNGVLSDTIVPRPSAVTTMYSSNQTELDHDDNADKILYFTPSLHGVTLGLSYTPSAQSEDDRGVAHNSRLWTAGIMAEQNIKGVDLSLSLGYARGTLDASGADTHNKVQALSAGLNLTYQGVTVGGSVARDHHSYPGRRAAAADVDNSGLAFDLGVMVVRAPLSVSLDYYRSAVRGSVGNPADDHVTALQLSTKYELGSGLALMAALAHMAYEDEAARSSSMSGLALISGVGLWF